MTLYYVGHDAHGGKYFAVVEDTAKPHDSHGGKHFAVVKDTAKFSYKLPHFPARSSAISHVYKRTLFPRSLRIKFILTNQKDPLLQLVEYSNRAS